MDEKLYLPYVEVEFRLGKKGYKFDTDIGENTYNKLKSVLDTYAKWNSIEIFQYTDNFYDTVRESCFDNTKNVIQKKKICIEDFENTSFDIRMNISQEIPSTIPHDKQISFSRNKQRISYITDSWKIDLTKVYCNDSYSYECELEFNIHYVRIHTLEFLKKQGISQLTNLLASANI